MKALKAVAVWVGLAGVVAGGVFLVIHVLATERAKKIERFLQEGRRCEEKGEWAAAVKAYEKMDADEGRKAIEALRALQPVIKALEECRLATAAGELDACSKKFAKSAGATRLQSTLDENRATYDRALEKGRKHEVALEADLAEPEYKHAAQINVEGDGAGSLARLAELKPIMALARAKKWQSAMQGVRQVTAHDCAHLVDHCVRGGTRIALRGVAGGKPHVRLVPATGGKPAEIVLAHATVLDPDWSPDGRKLIYCATASVAENGLYALDVASGRSALLAALPIPGDAVSCPRGGEGLIFCGALKDLAGMIVARPDATDAKALKIEGTPRNASASLDGASVAYQQFAGKISEVWIVDVATGERRRLSTEGVWAEMPAWSPDGRRIAFAMARDRNFDIYLCAPEGGEPARLTTGPEKDTCPAWSPDSARLAYITTREKKRVVVVRRMSTGTESVVAEVAGETDPRPAWSPYLPDE